MVRILLLSLLLISIYGCDNNIDTYARKEVRVFTEAQHSNIPAQFETVTEQTLFKEAYHEGATFETVTEQVLSKEKYTIYRISEQQNISLVTDASTYRIEEIPCIHFFDLIDYDTIEIPAVYVTRTYQRLDVDGNGPFHEATYNTIEYKRLDSEAMLKTIEPEDRDYITYNFVIPEESSLDSFIVQQLLLQELEDDCLKPDSYLVID